MDTGGRRRERLRERSRAREFGKYAKLAEALRRERRSDVALAWLGSEDVPDRLLPLLPGPESFASGPAVIERLLDVFRLGIVELPLLVGIAAAEAFLLPERNGYELSTRGSCLLDRAARSLSRIAKGDTSPRSTIDPLRHGVDPWLSQCRKELRKIVEYPDPSDAEYDSDDPANPYEDVTYGQYEYGTEMEHLPDAAAAMISLVEVATRTLADPGDGAPGPSEPSLLGAKANRWPAVAALEDVLYTALGNAGAGYEYAGLPDDFRDFFARATEEPIAWLLR